MKCTIVYRIWKSLEKSHKSWSVYIYVYIYYRDKFTILYFFNSVLAFGSLLKKINT